MISSGRMDGEFFPLFVEDSLLELLAMNVRCGDDEFNAELDERGCVNSRWKQHRRKLDLLLRGYFSALRVNLWTTIVGAIVV
jgi:hypothetical protein